MTERNFGSEAHLAAKNHIEMCWDWFYQEDTGDVKIPDPASTPFDGCIDCEIREILHAAWPFLLEGIVSGGLTHDQLGKAVRAHGKPAG